MRGLPIGTVAVFITVPLGWVGGEDGAVSSVKETKHMGMCGVMG